MSNTKPITWEESNTGCWICNSHSRTKGGRPHKKHKGKFSYISHIVYEKYKGEIPAGLFVLHTCDTPACINPDHLFLGTQKDNITDCINKNRARHGRLRGEEHGRAKLEECQVLKIRNAFGTLKDIANTYGVDITTVWKIKHKRIWKHIL